jgi:hypothetical protein
MGSMFIAQGGLPSGRRVQRFISYRRTAPAAAAQVLMQFDNSRVNGYFPQTRGMQLQVRIRT